MSVHEWEDEIAALLQELTDVQSGLLEMLGRKRQLLLDGKLEELGQLQPTEQALAERLQNCHGMRQALLSRAAAQGLPANNVRQLSAAIDGGAGKQIGKQIDQAASQTRLLQHTSLSNWVYVQKSLLHLSQLLEIIATGGRPEPTYGSAVNPPRSGSMVDQAV